MTNFQIVFHRHAPTSPTQAYILTVHIGNFSKAWRTPWGWSFRDRNMLEFYGIL